MKILQLLVFGVGVFLIGQVASSCDRGGGIVPTKSYSNIDSLTSQLLLTGIDSQRIGVLVKSLMPILLTPPYEYKIDNWYANKEVWLDDFGDAQNVLYCSEILFEKCLESNKLSTASLVKHAIGRIYVKDGEFAQGIREGEIAFELAKRAEDSVMIGWNLNFIGLTLAQLQDLPMAAEYEFRALDIARRINNAGLEAAALITLGAIKSYQTEMDSSYFLMKQGVQVAKENGYATIEKRGVLNISHNLNLEGCHDDAIAFLHRNIDFKDLSPTLANTFLHFNLFGGYLGKRDFKKASYFLDIGCNMAEKLGHVYAQMHCANYRRTFYETQGLYEPALVASKDFQAIQDTLRGVEQTREIQSMKTRLRLLEKDLEIEKLAQARKESDQAYKLRFRGSILVIGFLAIFIPGIFFYMRNRHRAISAEQQRQIAETKLHVLQSQMHPHFVFNALGGIQNYILKSEKIEAYNYLGKFATLLRTITKSSTQVHIALHQELEFIQSYLEMEKLRFRDNFVYTMNVEPSVLHSEMMIPGMVIQPAVENALIHGIAGLDRQGEVKINISPCCTRSGILCIVEDNGRGREAAKKIAAGQDAKGHLSIASVNTKKRLDFLRRIGYDEVESKIEDLFDENGRPIGTKVSIFLPYIKEEQIV